MEHEIINCPDDFAKEDDESFKNKLRLVAQSELHKIVARPRFIPYNDMINWALEHVDIKPEAPLATSRPSSSLFN